MCFVLVKSCLLLMATILFCCKAKSTLLRHGMNVWKGLCMGEMFTNSEKSLCHTGVWQRVYHCYLTQSDWQRFQDIIYLSIKVVYKIPLMQRLFVSPDAWIE